MTKANPTATLLIDDYIESLPTFSKEICETIRFLIHKTEQQIIEDWKWNRPIFINHKMVCGFSAHKNHVSLTFFNGANMSDQYQLFTGDCSAQHTRNIKFETSSEINKKQLLDYFKEAFLLENTVKQTKTSKKVEIPELLKNALEKNKLAKTNFENMAYTYRKEYALYILEAKREATKLSRLEKVIFNLEKNIKMHEQYKC
ncbi:YdeI/OmpD-associated family protein [Lutibacter sp.]|uniref:YdeI/OmpD-associated family protein n=1 Tax=Lutibacter sp. TaxID=1925666 RepID=UPI001A2ADCD0|nr:YdeI/OmpD-associated family protein [Lutibacter sp.]MBI9042504.1 YdeI/OmpD-associated family protein [Lutibacter sp.]